MKPVARAEILDYLTYGERREALRAAAMAAKDLRRVHEGPHRIARYALGAQRLSLCRPTSPSPGGQSIP